MVSVLQGQENIKQLQMKAFPSKRGPESSTTPSMITARPTASPQKVTWDEKRLHYYLKSAGKDNVFHHGAKQFSEPEVEAAWAHSSFREWPTRFTQGSCRHHILQLPRNKSEYEPPHAGQAVSCPLAAIGFVFLSPFKTQKTTAQKELVFSL